MRRKIRRIRFGRSNPQAKGINMIEMRWVEKVGHGLTGINKVETVKTNVLQYRQRVFVGAYAGMEQPNGWSDWIDVPTVKLVG